MPSLSQPRHLTSRMRNVAFLLLAAVALALRAFQLSQRTFYWDDLVIPVRFRDASFTEFFSSYDGHIMPGALAIQVLADGIAPLNFLLPAVTIFVLSAATLVFYALAISRLFSQRPEVQVLAFTALAFSPFLMVASGWWSAALNALGWQLGFAIVLFCAATIKQHPLRNSLLATAGLALAFTLTEKSLFIVPFAWAIVWLVARRVQWKFWLVPTIATALWAILVFTRTSVFHSDSPHSLLTSLHTTLAKAVIPGTLGGPWQWERWTPSQAFANPAPALWIPALLVAAVLLGVWIARRPARSLVLLPSAAIFLGLLWILGRARTGAETADLLTRTLHYYSEWWAWTVLLLVAASVSLPSSRRHLSPLPLILSLLLVASATFSTVSWVQAWRDDPTAEYLAKVKESTGPGSAPLLDQPVPLEVLTPLLNPYNTVASLTGTPPAKMIDAPRMLDPQGNVVEAAVLPAARTAVGDVPQCGTRVATGSSQIVEIDHPLPFGSWVWELNALASNKGMTMTISTPNGLESEEQSRARAVTVPLSTELKPEWVSVPGGGGTILVEISGGKPGDSMCLGAGNIGPLLPKQ